MYTLHPWNRLYRYSIDMCASGLLMKVVILHFKKCIPHVVKHITIEIKVPLIKSVFYEADHCNINAYTMGLFTGIGDFSP